MVNVIVNSCYIKSSQHYINYLEYSGKKLEAQTLVLNDGTKIELDPDELIDISETPDFRYIQLELKDGTIRRLGTEKYKEYVWQQTEEYQENEVNADENFSENDKLQARNPEIYLDYIAYRPGVEKNENYNHGLFGINGAVDMDTAKAAVLENENSIKWSHIISLTREGAEQTGFDNRQAWENLIRAKAYDIGKLYNIPPEHLAIMAAYHDKAHHPHCHLFFYSTANTTAEGCAGFADGDLARKSEKLRSIFNNEIFKNETSYLKEEKMQLRKEMKEEFDKYIRAIGKADYEPNQEIINVFSDLSNALSDYTGRAYYAYISPENKQKVCGFLRTAISSDSNLNQIYNKIFENQRSFISMYNDSEEKINTRLKHFEEHFFEPNGKNDFKQLHNIIIEHAMLFNQQISQPQQLADVVRKEEFSSFSNNDTFGLNSFSGNVVSMQKSNQPTTDTNKYWTDAFKAAKADLAEALSLEDDMTKAATLNNVLFVFMNEAANGNDIAAYELGRCYKLGTFGEINLDLSQQYYEAAFNGFLAELNSDNWLNNMVALDELRSYRRFYSPKEYEKKFNQAIRNIQRDEWLQDYLHYRVGRMLVAGEGTERDVQSGITHLEESSSTFAHYTLGNLYYYGDDIDADYQKAYDYFSLAGFPEEGKAMPFAIYNMAEMLEKRLVKDDQLSKDYLYEKALTEFIATEKQEPNDLIEYKIASMLLDGKGCKVDEDAAEEYLIKATEYGNTYAQTKLANLYIKRNDPWEAQKAVALLQLAAASGNDMAQYQLGKIRIDETSKYFNPNQGIELLEKSAEQDNDFALFTLGNIYLKGNITEKDIQSALRYLNTASDKGNQFAQYSLGIIYLNGKDEDIKADIDKAIQYLDLSANQGNAFAQYNLGKLYLENEDIRDIEKALGYLSKAEEQNNPYLQYNLGRIYLENKDIQNIDKAISFLIQSADESNPFAAYTLGNLYANNELIPADKEATDSWYTKAYEGFAAIEQDMNIETSDSVLYNLGIMNYEGLGTEKDIEKALSYLLKAAQNEHEFAEYKLGKIYLDGIDVGKNVEYASLWLTKAADKGNQFAQYALGKAMIEEVNIQDIPKGIAYLKAAAEQDNDFAQYTLGKLYVDGTIIPKNINYGIKLLSDSAKQKNQYAQYKLGKLYLEGIDTPKDINKALALLNAAADQNNQFAQYQLGKLYYYGTDVPKDIVKATAYFRAAAKQGNIFAQRKLYYISNQNPNKNSYATSLLLSRIANALSTLAMQYAYNKQQQQEDEQERKEQPKFAAKSHQHSKAHLAVQTPISR